MTVSIEALALSHADKVDSLPEPTAAETSEGSLTAALQQNDVFRQTMALAASDPPITDPPMMDPPIVDTARTSPTVADTATAAATQSEPVEAEPELAEAPPLTPEQALQFSGSIGSGTSRKAWFLDLRNGETYRLTSNQMLKFSDFSLKVLSVTDDSVVVEYDGEKHVIPLGKSLVDPPSAAVLPESSPEADSVPAAAGSPAETVTSSRISRKSPI